jgi:tetratricopeptide (TPR) repeat protein
MSSPRAAGGWESDYPVAKRLRACGAALLLVTAVAATYSPVRENGFVWDDDQHVLENPTLPDPNGLRRIWLEIGATPQYYPLVHTAYWIEYRLWGVDAAGYHVANVALHTMSALLAWRLLAFLGVSGAFAAAVMFALHPVHVESVAWITERKNVLSGAFYLSSALAYLRFALGPTRSKGFAYALSLCLFTAALLSKTVTCSLPAVLLLMLWWKRGRVSAADVVPLLPFFAIGLGLAGITVWMEKTHVGAVGPEWALSPFQRIAIAGRALWFYLGKLLWPLRLSFVYPRWDVHSLAAWQLVCPAAALACGAALFAARNRIGRGPIVAALIFAGTLLPALGFFDVYPMRFSFVADHFQYLASLAPIALVCTGAARMASAAGVWGRRAGVVAVAILALALGARTARQLPTYRSLESLWRDTLASNPAAWLAHYNLGNALRRAGDMDGAIRHYRETLALKEDHADAHANLASALGLRGEISEAQEHFARAVEICPECTLARHQLAEAMALSGDYPAAVVELREVLRQRPEYVEAHRSLALALTRIGDHEGARAHLREIERLRSNPP